MNDKKIIDVQAVTVRDAVGALDNQPVTVEQMICRGIDKGLPVDTMERLLAMRRELKSEHAKEAYNCAMAQFQAECPEIHKTKAVMHNGSVRYRYAPLECIIEQVKEVLARNGFSHKEDAIVEPGWVTGICKVTHTGGHSEQTTFKVPIDPKAFMNEAQKFASAFTFTKRYAFCAAFGIMTADEDDDSQSSGEPRQAQAPSQRIEHPRNQAPAPKPAAPAQQPQASGDGITDYPTVNVLTVKEVHSKPDAPKKWTAYFVRFSDGLGELEAATFDAKVADLANDLANTNENASLKVKPGRKPGSREIVSLQRAEQPPQVDQAPMDFDAQGNPVDIIP